MRSKYNAVRTEVDGIVFDSRREAQRWCELCLLSAAGEIQDLRRQVKFELVPKFEANGVKYRGVSYIADFTYLKNNQLVVEDVKGVKTTVYALKRQLMAWKQGITITEV
jgi:hypothetical protein